ncbi:GroES-like protein [Xylariomycetidae sp. FL0641]|nr:GroES-like protein [Xylariomycetidae sp. FL0641]
MTATPTMNRALWQDRAGGVPGVIREAPLPAPEDLGDRQVLVRVHAWAMNPCDGLLQETALPFVTYPVILGQDVAGTVAAVAPGSAAAERFRVGDRVFGFTANHGFQEHVPLDHTLMAPIPRADLAYRDVVGFGLCATTASFSLFGRDFLALQPPTLAGARKLGRTLLVWGASSAAGSNAVQLATAAGYDVVATCSPRNFDYVRDLGAVVAFDYNDPEATEKIVAELDQGDCAGIYMAAGSNAAACKVAAASKQKLLVASSNPVAPADVPDGVEAKFTFGTGSGAELFAETLPVTFGGYLVDALAHGAYKVAPPPRVVNRRGLDGVQEALDLIKRGASATKLVVERA